jgi:hypothetical protein
MRSLNGFVFLLTLGLSGIIPQSIAQTDCGRVSSSTSGQPVTNPYDWFRIGEAYLEIATQPYNFTVADSVKERYRAVRDLLVKAHANEPSVTAFDVHARVALGLPWQKSYAYWTDQEKSTWDNDATWDSMMKALARNRSTNPEADYFFRLGFQSNQLGWYIPYRQEDGCLISECMSNLTNAISDYVRLEICSPSEPGNSCLFAQLTPEVQAAIRTISSKKSKLASEPLEGGSGLQLSDIDEIVRAACLIRRAARDSALVR